jgi:hypothetical protein
MRFPEPPPEFTYVMAKVDSLRRKANDKGGVTLEWMVVAGAIFVVAIAVAAKVTSVIRKHAGKIK